MASRATFRRQQNPVSTGSNRGRITALWALQEVTAAVAILSLGITTVRPKARRVNTKPSQKYFVKCAALRNWPPASHFNRKSYEIGGTAYAQLGFDLGGGVGNGLVAKAQMGGDFTEAAPFA